MISVMDQQSIRDGLISGVKLECADAPNGHIIRQWASLQPYIKKDHVQTLKTN